jgi:hypothetical protein
VNPYLTGELARLRALEIAREATRHHQHHIPRPMSTPAGFLFSVSPRHALSRHRADIGLRERIGLTFIRLGMRYVDPVTHIRRTGGNG